MSKRRISPLRDKEKLIAVLETAQCKKDVLIAFGLRAAGGNYRRLDEILNEYGLGIPEENIHQKILQKRFSSAPIKYEMLFTENFRHSRYAIKRRLKENGFPQLCSECGLTETWNGKPLVLHLEHINGVYNDNRLENLTLLCPNCHSQTKTYAGHNITTARGKEPKEAKVIKRCQCGKTMRSDKYERCSACRKASRPKRVFNQYPPLEEIYEVVRRDGYRAAGVFCGVSDNAVRKHILKMEGTLPIVRLDTNKKSPQAD